MATASQARTSAATAWMRAKLQCFSSPARAPLALRRLARAQAQGVGQAEPPRFANPFHLRDLAVFDDETLRQALLRVDTVSLAQGLQDSRPHLVARLRAALAPALTTTFDATYACPVDPSQRALARRTVLDTLFWELTYWKTPARYDELTAGERIHPGVFGALRREIADKVVADIGAGTGRASRECLRYGARQVIAVEPTPGLRRILARRLARPLAQGALLLLPGRLNAVPLPDGSVDLALACSTFTAAEQQGGETGLAEMRRITRPGGKIVIIWPLPQDFAWLAAHGFHYACAPVPDSMAVVFRSWRSAARMARRFCGHAPAVERYVRERRATTIPFAVLGVNPPHDFCWRVVEAPAGAPTHR